MRAKHSLNVYISDVWINQKSLTSIFNVFEFSRSRFAERFRSHILFRFRLIRRDIVFEDRYLIFLVSRTLCNFAPHRGWGILSRDGREIHFLRRNNDVCHKRLFQDIPQGPGSLGFSTEKIFIYLGRKLSQSFNRRIKKRKINTFLKKNLFCQKRYWRVRQKRCKDCDKCGCVVN